ncbi:uncharacterized protein LOC104889342 isoform X1 [Beta vulgaris subsp. vulgaris]|uniref:uncharacterized protein LOC104889342 isoform X1 n=1 Tax=Beta vulgaris subsp. vulgaris TaxID=3555 RepID=UPI0020371D43|nr:uncharacterized protein LOC104889342 isoform X1 [Beta vulgaris subsp. vulgaris]
MGSLLSGWDSPIQDPKFASLMRNKSLTKERIEEYWKHKKNTEKEHLKAISEVEESLSEDIAPNELIRSNSLPMIGRKNGKSILTKESEMELKHLGNCWWTRSNWAFLNEPPVIEGEVPKYKYASQYHIANLASPKLDTRISSI